ncbi:MAG TPA: hypothetical protein VIM11_09935 [Tepidisphaeraceae bacterium]
MRKHLLPFASALSLLLMLITLVAWIASNGRHWQDRPVHIAGQINFATSDGTIALFNQSRPYFNGTMSISARNAPPASRPREISARFPGFHFRHFTWPGHFPGGTYWTLAISLLYPLALSTICPIAWCIAWLRRRDNSDFCRTCSYNLKGNQSGTCPECGTPISPSPLSP